ncbi:hypothetical protein [Arthrobacter pascens]|jgi:hypothetical protein|uniref:hypothetical protein n=1 Tax=Arthrobacter pascens TaxID=1677 RepID=UPI00196A912E|nr:hypothetical protein [Arthrobacter pascens]MBN3498193.1 hypothetical protein [Arthrobacter pascens]MDR6558395.1 hypothetical protein [Arthrobacter pascens]
MNTTGTNPEPARRTIESDPAYDFADDAPVEEDWDTEDEFLDSEERVVPAAPEAVDDDERVVSLDADEFRADEEYES